jgi:hypothetical protein
MRPTEEKSDLRVREQTGTCGEAQADGVPCPDPTRSCETCAASAEARQVPASTRRPA